MPEEHHLSSHDAKQFILSEIDELPVDGSYKVVIKKIVNQRTLTQNSAIHKYFDLLAKSLNAGGYSFNRIMLRRPFRFIEQKRKEMSGHSDHPYNQGYLKALDDIFKLLPRVLVSWTAETVKDFLWRQVQKSMTQKESTIDLTRQECSEVYDQLDRFTSSEFGIHVDFPSKKNNE